MVLEQLKQALAVCRMHREALQDALEDLEVRPFCQEWLAQLSREDRRLLDQFAYRFLRLQDTIGQQLIPSILRALGEPVEEMPVIDRLNRLEQLGWLSSADEWMMLRRIRNELTHDYPQTLEERLETLKMARSAAYRLLEVFEQLEERITTRFPELVG
ncbi:hypothetical protein ABUL39_08125 [Rhodothermus marinus]|uniref:hypothetical protein n=1 Tax=Rhodothermus marinus TaxID=29549 RepID=UPI0037C8B66B